MLSQKFSLSAIAILVASAPMLAQSAIFEIKPIQQGINGETVVASVISADGTQVGVGVLKGPQGLDYNEELPFMVDVENQINSLLDLQGYCDVYLGYNTCEAWANEHWFGTQASGEICNTGSDPQNCNGGLRKEMVAWTEGYRSNGTAFIGDAQVNPFSAGIAGTPPAGTINPDSTNVEITGFSGTTAVGISSSPYFTDAGINARAFSRRGFFGSLELTPPAEVVAADALIANMGQTNARGVIDVAGSPMVFGSASVARMAGPQFEQSAPESTGLPNLLTCGDNIASSPFPGFTTQACQYFSYANQAAVWLNPADAASAAAIPVATNFPSGTIGNVDETAQASIKGAAVLTGDIGPTLVGFSTYNEQSHFFANAVKWTPVTDYATKCATPNSSCWGESVIIGPPLFNGNNELIYRYSMANAINTAGVIVGGIKNARNNHGTFTEQVFVHDSSKNTTAILTEADSRLFFSGANMTASDISRTNLIIGRVDIENVRDRERRQRGYLFQYGATADLAPFDGQRGWLLDDLVNDGDAAGEANKYRIYDALDINDDGTIAASAFYCAQGYESTAQDALCPGREELAAITLTPNLTGKIIPREQGQISIGRDGGSVGFGALVMLAIGGLWQRRKQEK